MSKAEHDHRTSPDVSGEKFQGVRLCLKKTGTSLERTQKAIAKSHQAIAQARVHLAGSIGVSPPGLECQILPRTPLPSVPPPRLLP